VPSVKLTFERPFTPDDLGDVDVPELYHKEDGSIGPLFTPEERAESIARCERAEQVEFRPYDD
jgi:hypothetical protein